MQKPGVFWARSIHVSWLIAAMSAGVLAGIALSAVFDALLLANIAWLLASSLLLLLVFWKRVRWLVLVALLGGCLIGLWRGSLSQIGLDQYQQFIGQEVVVTGIVSEDVVTKGAGQQQIKLNKLSINTKQMTGQVWLSTSVSLSVKRSDTITLYGVLNEGFGNFAASMYRAQITSIERANYGDVARDVRDAFAASVRSGIQEPEASLGVGFLTGQRSTLPLELDEQLKIVGLTHIVVASGYNLTILVRFTRRIFARVSKFLATATAGGLIVGFVLMTGFSPSMSRAGLVAGLSLIAWYYGRVIHPVVLLLCVAGLTAFINPLYVWGDIGWYLSFAAFAGVIILAPLVHDFFWGHKKQAGWVRQILVDTSCAQAATMPIMAFAFGTYSLYALPANLLVLALVPFAMLLVFITGLAGLLVPALVTIIGWPAQALLTYITHVVSWLAGKPGAQGEVVFTLPLLLLSYGVLFAIGYVLWKKTNHSFRTDSIVE
jgi:competence protein ComEC